MLAIRIGSFVEGLQHAGYAIAGTLSPMPQRQSEGIGIDGLSARAALHPLEPVAAHSSVTDQNQANFGPQPHDLPQDQETDLHEKLLDLGKEGRLSITALTKYRVILETPEVRRRATRGADDAELAECAAAAIRDFINDIASSLDKEVVQAALAITERFVGKQISERVTELHTTESNFKRRRTTQFAELVRYLRRYPRISTPAPDLLERHLTRERQWYVIDGLNTLAAAAFALHFAAIASLFAFSFPNGGPSLVESEDFACEEHLFYSFTHFLTRAANWRDIPPSARCTGISFAQATDRDLLSLVDDATALWPLADPKRSEVGLPPHFEAILEQGGSLYHRDLFDEMWWPWYQHHTPSGVELLKVKSGLVAEGAYPHTSPHTRTKMVEKGKHLAYRALARLYGRNLRGYLTPTDTLEEHARAFFQTNMCDLLKR